MSQMSQKPPYVAFFDLDDTLLSTNSGRVFWDYCYQNAIYTPIEIGILSFSLFKYLIGYEETEDFIRTWARCFKGWSEERMLNITQDVFNTRLRQVIRESAKAEVKRHQSNGARTVILSASTKFVCDPIREHLAMDEVLCTHLAVENGTFTGELASPYVFGEQKYLSALRYAQENEFSLESCYYYGDAHTDRFVMEAVGNPVCVSPDRKLRAYAAQKNWKIVEW